MTESREGRRWRNLAGLARRGRPAVGSTPADVVHRENKMRLLRYRPSAGVPQHRTPLLLVPSLINRHYVLDLMPGKSLVEWLVARGHDVYCIDWGTPGPEDRYLTFDRIVDGYLGRAILRACRASGVERLHLLGYCLGGTLAAIHAAARPARVAGLIALAAPVDFIDDGLLAIWSRSRAFDPAAASDAFGNVPWQLLQATFHMLRPTLNLSKFHHLVDRAWDDEFLDGFLAIETWGNDNISFPGACFVRYIQELYRENAIVAGRFALSGEPVRLERVVAPTLAITFEHDNIVPAGSAVPLVDGVGAGDVEHIHLPGGHVGAVVSRKASTTLWPRISDWLVARDCPDDIRGGGRSS